MNSEHSGFGIQAVWMPDRSEVRVIRMKRLSELLSVSRSTLYDWLNPGSPRYDPAFPRPIRLSAKGGAVGWLVEDVMRWLDTRK
ncbi:helix-turn-helix transcriptional regulator [Pseudomonas aeruginosa]|uniref:helix-turn-helix transcriptional regulator n=2 Tax=Pseudomonas aeruginosa TaxID=287 RepID=UPI0007A9CE8F|nr:AlpA family phage regulatory protein [Pseudomonas aeruginosa]SAJ33581.1 phage transcriptional regulator AlpA [Enterobacter cloacae]